jgi:hypothetical protein
MTSTDALATHQRAELFKGEPVPLFRLIVAGIWHEPIGSLRYRPAFSALLKLPQQMNTDATELVQSVHSWLVLERVSSSTKPNCCPMHREWNRVFTLFRPIFFGQGGGGK